MFNQENTLGQFVAIEGTDGSGKATQLTRLKTRLVDNGYEVVPIAFPQYDRSLFGQMAGRMLRGDLGEYDTIHPQLATLPYALDRWTAAPQIQQAINRGAIVISDRYTLSAKAHQSARLSEVEREEFVAWVDNLEHRILGIPRPDLYLFLRVPPDVSQDLIRKKAERKYLGGKKDQLEADIAHQTEASRMYVELANNDPAIKVIECTREGQLLSIDEIHEIVWSQVSSLLVR